MASPSLEDNIQTTSKAGDVSLARQRRRRTTRKSLSKSLNHTELQNGDKNSIPLTQQQSESRGDPLQPTQTLSTDNGERTTSSGGSARERRTQRKRESVHRGVAATIEQTDFTPHVQQPELEDSTAGVASLLERNLDQTSGTETPEQQRDPGGEVIASSSSGIQSPNRLTTEAEHIYQRNVGENQQGDPLVNGEAPTYKISIHFHDTYSQVVVVSLIQTLLKVQLQIYLLDKNNPWIAISGSEPTPDCQSVFGFLATLFTLICYPYHHQNSDRCRLTWIYHVTIPPILSLKGQSHCPTISLA